MQGLLVQVLIADDHHLVIEGLKLKLAELSAEIRFAVATTADELSAALQRDGTAFDLALLDLAMPGAQGYSHVEQARREHPALAIVVLSGNEDAGVMRRLLDIGVRGFVPKAYPPDVMLSAVRLVLSGGVYVPPMMLNPPATSLPLSEPTVAAYAMADGVDALRRLLTERQVDVLRLLSQGRPNKLIARHLGISEGTVKIHLAAIYRALNVRNRTEAVVASGKITSL
jgi:DNA-binding NarL/FixJ family response regulator